MIVAVAIADLHLCHRRPSGRGDEDWYGAMARILRQVDVVAKEHDVPVLAAGDVFHRYNPPPALINFAIDVLPDNMWAIPGQHDQQHHRQSLEPTAFQTLIKAGAIRPVEGSVSFGSLVVHGFGWGEEVQPLNRSEWESHCVHLALIHKYCATEKTAHPGADQSSRPSFMRGMLRGYDAAVFGDNHVPFESRSGSCLVYNCGCLLRRSRNERLHESSVGLVHDNGSVERLQLDCSEDVWIDDAVADVAAMDFSGFVAELDAASVEALDFKASLRRAAESQSQVVKAVLLELLDGQEEHG